MNTAKVRNAYRQSESQANINPVKLIHMMYDRLLIHLNSAMENIARGELAKRGDNLGKSIALLTELNASIADDDSSEAANFLRGLYGAILQELPKVSLDNDTKILQQAINYIEKLKDIWEQTAMVECEAARPTTVKKVDHLQRSKDLADIPEYSGQSLSVSI